MLPSRLRFCCVFVYRVVDYCRGLLPWAPDTGYCRRLLPWATAVGYCRWLLPLATAVMHWAVPRHAGLFAAVAGAEQHLPVLPKRAAVIEYGGGEREEEQARSERGRIVAQLLQLRRRHHGVSSANIVACPCPGARRVVTLNPFRTAPHAFGNKSTHGF